MNAQGSRAPSLSLNPMRGDSGLGDDEERSHSVSIGRADALPAPKAQQALAKAIGQLGTGPPIPGALRLPPAAAPHQRGPPRRQAGLQPEPDEHDPTDARRCPDPPNPGMAAEPGPPRGPSSRTTRPMQFVQGRMRAEPDADGVERPTEATVAQIEDRISTLETTLNDIIADLSKAMEGIDTSCHDLFAKREGQW